MADRDYAAIARKYAADVVAGRIIAGKSIRLQAQRFLDELKASKGAGFPYRFDPEKAARPCRFTERLPHTKGPWAREKKRLVLEPWQVWVLCVTFGWVRKKTGLRRFRRLFLIVPRKNGKSALAAPIGLYMLLADGEFGAEVYSGATNEKQAHEVWRPARLMVDRTPQLKRHFGVGLTAKAIVKLADLSRFETLVGDPGDGQSPSCSIHDEYHEHRDNGQVEAMRTGMGARDQPLQVIITTAGDNLAGPCYAEVVDERKKLEGLGVVKRDLAMRAKLGLPPGPAIDDITIFFEYAADEGDDWKSDLVLRKANPNFDVSVQADFLRAEQRDAIAKPRRAGIFKTKHLNLWVSAKTAYFDVEAWRRCRDDRLPEKAADALALDWLRGRRVILGLDLASKRDITALEYLFLPEGEKATRDDPYIRIGRYYLPAETVQDVPTYIGWHEQGLLDVTDGNVVDYDAIVEAIDEATSLFQVEHVPFDPHNATMLVTTLMKRGAPVIEYRPIVLNFSEPMKELDALIVSRRIIHGGDPVMEWQISNVVGDPDKKDNVYPNKPEGQAHLKIDNPVALMSALGVAMGEKEENMPTSPWDDPEFTLADV